jgi:hypothetical protein
MSTAPGLPRLTLRADRSASLASQAASLHRLPVYLACSVLAVVTNFLLGKELAWDTLNYHLYAGFSAVHDRFTQDYFAAGPQAYFNPYAYVPFYAMVKAGMPALLVGSVLALAHSSVLWLTFELGVCAAPSDDSRTRLTVGVLAAAMALMNPILLQQIGSSFADITTAIPVLAGWLLLVRAVRTPRPLLVLAAGLLLGAACALKLTNAVHAVAAAAVLVVLPQPPRDRLRRALGYGVGLAVAFALVAAPWSYRLEQVFGNPFFPLLNTVFRSPHFTTEPLQHFRFIPATFGEALWRPFAILDTHSMVQEELRAPDLRYAALVVLGVLLLGHWLWLRLARSSATPSPESTASSRVFAALGCGFAVDWILWLLASGNGRYFLSMACIAGVLLFSLLFRLCATKPKVRNYVLAALFGLQALQLWAGTDYRWEPEKWGGPWFKLEIPRELATEPNLYLTLGLQSYSFFAPYLEKSSGLINVVGQYTLGADGANGEHIAALVHRYAPHVRVLLRSRQLHPDTRQFQQLRTGADSLLADFALHVDSDDCATIVIHDLPPPLEFRFTDRDSPPVELDTSYLLSCRLVPGSVNSPALALRERAVDTVFDRLEDACPALFQPRHTRSEHRGDTWRRRYVNTDVTVYLSHGRVAMQGLYSSAIGDTSVYLGLESDWQAARVHLACGRHDGEVFAKVLEPK